jgi:tricorn protease
VYSPEDHTVRTVLLLAVSATGLLFVPGIGRAEPDLQDTRLLTQPAVSAKNVAFIYADDLWVADLDGKNVRRLTSDIGVESNPVFSPDGNIIAFSAQYDGNTDVYTVPVSGGNPTRLTYHPGPDIVRGFTPDGKSVLFSSPRNVHTGRFTQLFTVPLTGGMPTQLPIPNGVEACYSPDGTQIAYTPLRDVTAQWKHYRGGTHSRIWVYNCKDHEVVEIPQPKEGCNDLSPEWLGETVYFRSDRNGEYNLFSYDTKVKNVQQLTHYEDFPVAALGAGGGRLIYEQAGYLHTYNPAEGADNADHRLKIGVATDLVEARPRWVKGAKFIRNASVSPSGARAVFEFRGEIVTVPASKGDPRNLTETPGVHERSPAWSPDGKSIAYFSDEGGEYQLHVKPADGKGKAKTYAPQGHGFYDMPTWSPDSKKIAYQDNSQSLYVIDLESGKVTKIASEPQYGPGRARTLRPAWSPDSKWIAYALGNKAAYHTIYAYDVATGQSKAITDGLSDAIDPTFDAGGKYLYFLASTDAGPVNQWFAQSNADMRIHRTPHLVVLKKGEPSPLARESDEEKAKDKDESKDGKPKDKPAKDDKPKDKAEVKPTVIDFDGIDQRIVALPVPAGNYRQLNAGSAGQVYYIENPAEQTPGPGAPAGGKLVRFDLSKRKSEDVQPGVADYVLTADGSKALVFSPPESWSIIPVGAPPMLGKDLKDLMALKDTKDTKDTKLKIDAIEVKIDPRAEWAQMFDEAWRINRDYFYDPQMHGADWPAMKKKYAQLLPHLATRGDLDRVIRGMLSELAVGHSYLGGGERLHERKPVPGGLLGADYEIANGRYRFKKVYGGLNWSPELRAPLTAPGVDVKAGEYLLAVRGIDLKPPTEVYSLFENTANKSIEITVGPNADGKDSRTVTVEPLASEDALRNADWVEGNLRKVQKATGGRVAYVYVPNTAGLGHAYFKRYFFPQADKDAIIIDERYNGGGQVADYYIDHLRRPFTAMWATRYGEDIKTPGGAIFGPKVMLIDENAGSGGDLLPWMFRQYKLGPLVGKRTWGGLVGILGFPVLMDGGGVTAPNLAFWTDEGWKVENEGVPPDVEVEQLPKEVIAGKDPQLDKAIEMVLKKLEENPPKTAKKPPFPIRVAKPAGAGN